jgi:hypothetical protein
VGNCQATGGPGATAQGQVGKLAVGGAARMVGVEKGRVVLWTLAALWFVG